MDLAYLCILFQKHSNLDLEEVKLMLVRNYVGANGQLKETDLSIHFLHIDPIRRNI